MQDSNMKKIAIVLFIGMVAILMVGCGRYRSQASYEMPSQVLSANYDGSYVIRVRIRARNGAIAFTDGQRKAVKEVLFDGVAAGSNGIEALQPICFDKNIQAKHEDYFNAFFSDGGDWTKYASLKDKRTGTTKYERDGKQMVETVVVTVNRSELKKRMQEDGIIPAQNMYEL